MGSLGNFLKWNIPLTYVNTFKISRLFPCIYFSRKQHTKWPLIFSWWKKERRVRVEREERERGEDWIPISYGLLRAVSIVMANEERGFPRFFSVYVAQSSLYVLLFVPCAPLLAASMATANEDLHIRHCTLGKCSSVCALMHFVIIKHLELCMSSQLFLCPWQTLPPSTSSG